MSEQAGQCVASEGALCNIIERVPTHRLAAAEQLLQRKPKMRSLAAIIEHVPGYRDRAARQLLALEPEHHLDYNPIFMHVSSPILRRRAGELILAKPNPSRCSCGYAMVAEQVNSLRPQAMAMLLEVGPDYCHGLNTIWRYADPACRQEQWQKYLDKGERTRFNFREIILNGVEDLPDRAWSELSKDRLDNSFLAEMLDHPQAQSRAWKLMVANGFEDDGLLYTILQKHDSLREAAWAEVGKLAARSGTGVRLIYVKTVTWKEAPRWIRDRAARALLAGNPSEKELGILTIHDPFRNEAARRLLAGEFTKEPQAA